MPSPSLSGGSGRGPSALNPRSYAFMEFTKSLATDAVSNHELTPTGMLPYTAPDERKSTRGASRWREHQLITCEAPSTIWRNIASGRECVSKADAAVAA